MNLLQQTLEKHRTELEMIRTFLIHAQSMNIQQLTLRGEFQADGGDLYHCGIKFNILLQDGREIYLVDYLEIEDFMYEYEQDEYIDSVELEKIESSYNLLKELQSNDNELFDQIQQLVYYIDDMIVRENEVHYEFDWSSEEIQAQIEQIKNI